MIERIPVSDDSHIGRYCDGSGQTLLACFEELFSRLMGYFVQRRTFERAKALACGLLCSDWPHTITNWLIACGRQYGGWRSNYDFFSKAKWEAEGIFDVILEETGRCYPKEWQYFVAALDEVHLPKNGRKIPGACVLRNPLGLAYPKGLHLAQRWLSTSALIPSEGVIEGPARGIPVDFRCAPPAKKPGKKASNEQRRLYKVESKEKSISVQGARSLIDMRRRLDKNGMSDKILVSSVDGSFTNGTFLGEIPERTVVIGRTRKDVKLYAPPGEYCGRGRRLKYGEQLPTPEQIRQDKSIPWREARVWAAGKEHILRYKTIGPVLWKGVTRDKPLRLIVIEPLAYRPRKGAKLLYRKPAYLLVSDVDFDVELALQCYCHRWEIEVNHRDAKSIIGVGQAQVRDKESAHRVPEFAMAVYALALLASVMAYGSRRGEEYGRLAAWRNDNRPRPSTSDIVRQYRRELEQAGTMSFRGFASRTVMMQTPEISRQLSAEMAGSVALHAEKGMTIPPS